MKNNYYINFLNFVKALEPSVETDQLDVTSKLILDEIAIGVAKEKPMTVSEVMGLKGLGSPATLHRKLTILLTTREMVIITIILLRAVVIVIQLI